MEEREGTDPPIHRRAGAVGVGEGAVEVPADLPLGARGEGVQRGVQPREPQLPLLKGGG